MIALILILCLFSSEATSQEKWPQVLKEAELLDSKHLHAEAENRYAAALEEARKLDPEGLPVGVVLNSIGYHDWLLGQIREAAWKYARALDIFERKLPRGHNDVIEVAMNLSSVYLEEGEISKAGSLLRRFLTIEAELSSENRAALLGDLGSILMQQGDLDESERMFREAVALLEEEKNESALVRRVIALSNLSAVYAQSGRLSDALDCSRRARAVMSTIENPPPVVVIKTLANAAALSVAIGRRDEAESLYQQAILFCENTFGPGHYLLGDVLEAYSQFLHLTKRGSEARKVEKRAKVLQERFRRENVMGFTIDAKVLMEDGRTRKRSGEIRQGIAEGAFTKP